MINRRELLGFLGIGIVPMAFGEARAEGFNNQLLARLLVANSIINSKGMFFYSGKPALGNLIESVGVAASGVDSFGNVYDAGDTVYQIGAGSLAIAQLFNGNLRVGQASQFAGTGGAFPAQVGMDSANDIGTLGLQSGAANAGDVQAFLTLVSAVASGGVLKDQVQTASPLVLLPSTAPPTLSGATMWGDATGRVLAKNLSGRNQTLSGGSNTQLNSVTVAGASGVIASASIPAGDAIAGAVYELVAFGNGVVGNPAGIMTWGVALNGAVLGLANGPAAAAISAALGLRWTATARYVIRAAGSGGTLVSALDGVVTQTQNNIIPGTPADESVPFACGSNVTSAIDTTVANTFQIIVNTTSGTGATLTSIGAYLKRVA